jgi:precorrin-2 dehydrogenase/sirohydrochlorin ferrochelatase
MLDVTQRPIVIVGGGAVAARKANGLLAAAATRVTVVSPQFCDAIPPAVRRITAPYAPDHLAGAGLVFAATDNPDVNAAVVRDAHQLGLLVCRADSADDDDHSGDFATPAAFRDDGLVVTVSAGGSPTLAAALRDHLRAATDVRWSLMARAMQALRPRTIQSYAPGARRAVLREMATADAMDVLQTAGVDGLWSWLRQRHPNEDVK